MTFWYIWNGRIKKACHLSDSCLCCCLTRELWGGWWSTTEFIVYWNYKGDWTGFVRCKLSFRASDGTSTVNPQRQMHILLKASQCMFQSDFSMQFVPNQENLVLFVCNIHKCIHLNSDGKKNKLWNMHASFLNALLSKHVKSKTLTDLI